MMCTRPDIYHAVGGVSRFLSNPGKEHWAAVTISSWEEDEEASSKQEKEPSQDPNEEGRRLEAYLASDRGKKKRLASIIIKEGDKERPPKKKN